MLFVELSDVMVHSTILNLMIIVLRCLTFSTLELFCGMVCNVVLIFLESILNCNVKSIKTATISKSVVHKMKETVRTVIVT